MKITVFILAIFLPVCALCNVIGEGLVEVRSLKKIKNPKCPLAKKMKKLDKKLKKEEKKDKKMKVKGGKKGKKAKSMKSFNRVSTFLICSQTDPTCNTDVETNAEVLAASKDGMTIVYSDSEKEEIGFVDISNPSAPIGLGVVELSGEPTSVDVLGEYAIVAINTSEDYVNTSGELIAISIPEQKIIKTWILGGQPNTVAVSPDEDYIAITIENERDEDLGDGAPPQFPAGYVVVVDASSDDIEVWSANQVQLTGLDGIRFPEDPEPESVDINVHNICVVTLQENNGIVLIDLKTLSILDSFSAGTVDLVNVDTEEEGVIDQTDTLTGVPREPDGVSWVGSKYFATADEGDLDGGSRGFSIFDICGNIVYSSLSEMEHIVTSVGHYPEERSGNKGNEPENVEFATFDGNDFLFVISEASSLVFVYDVSNLSKPKFLQVLPAGLAPEGGKAIPSRNLLVVASEKDDRGDKIRSVINIYQYGPGSRPQYPTLVSADGDNGLPIPWSAISGLAAAAGVGNTLYAVEDSFYDSSRFFTIDTSRYPAILTKATKIVDTNGVFASVPPYGEFTEDDLDALINDDGSVNIDPEGIAVAENGGHFWIVSEGRGTIGDEKRPIESLNFLLKVDPEGTIVDVLTLPNEANDKQLRFGLEGIALYGSLVTVICQRAWGDDPFPLIFVYDDEKKEWILEAYYPLDSVESQNGGWVGLSDIASIGDMKYLIVERDNQNGPDAAIKRIYSIDLSGVSSGDVIEKTLFMDLMPFLTIAGGLPYEKIEGMTVTEDGHVWIINDNDGVDDNSGETQLMDLGKFF